MELQIVKTTDIELGTVDDPASKPIERPQNFHAVLKCVVPVDHKVYFEKEWLSDVHVVVASFKGFIKRSVIFLSAKGGFCEYIVILVFDSIDHYSFWNESEDIRELIKVLSRKGGSVSKIDAYGDSGESSGKPRRIAVQDSLSSIPLPMPPPKVRMDILYITFFISRQILLLLCIKWKLTIIITVCVYVAVVFTGIVSSIPK
jgi:hypothetical protein